MGGGLRRLLTLAEVSRERRARCPAASNISVAYQQHVDQLQGESSPHVAELIECVHILTKSKRYFGQRQRSARTVFPGSVPSLSGPTYNPESSSHPCLCKSVWITPMETQPRAPLLAGLVPDLHHITPIIHFFSLLPPFCMESIYWSARELTTAA